jgi:trimeric autotransporter adhesin
MKRYITRVIVLLLAGMLVSCGGGGGDSSSGGGNSGTINDGNAGNDSGGDPGDDGAGDPGNDGGGTGTLPSAGAHVEESDAAVTLSAGWMPSESRAGWSGGAAQQSTVAGATASFTFTGTSVRWIGRRSRFNGIALVRVDGGPAIEVDLFGRPDEIRTPVLTLYGLSEGQHTLTIEVTGRQHPNADANVVVVDAFDVQPPIVSHLQETDPDITFSAGWVHLDDGKWSGGSVRSGSEPAFGGARATETAGASLTLKFRGTGISWIGYRGSNAGIARVLVDGSLISEVDTYAAKEKVQEVVFTATGLADTTHTLTIEATGRKNDASTGVQIVVDAFDVTTPGRRFEQSDPAITYTGTWDTGNNNRTWSEGVAAVSFTLGSSATFSFTGTSVSWIGCKKSTIGRAKIYIDGAFVTEVNNFKPVGIEGYQHTIFRADGLTDGPHTLTVEVAANGAVVVDAFDVHP